MIGDITSWCGIEGPQKKGDGGGSGGGNTDRFALLKETINRIQGELSLTDTDVIAIRWNRGKVYFGIVNGISPNKQVYSQAVLPIQGQFPNGDSYEGIIVDPVAGHIITSTNYNFSGSAGRIRIVTYGLIDSPVYTIYARNNYGAYYGEGRQSISMYPDASYLTKEELFAELDTYK